MRCQFHTRSRTSSGMQRRLAYAVHVVMALVSFLMVCVLHMAGIPALRMQHWLKPSYTEESEDSARADLARKPDPFFPASPRSSSAAQHSSGARPAAPSGGAGVSAPEEADCDHSGGESAADWVLSALSKPSSQNGASRHAASNGSAGSSNTNSNGAHAAPWLPGSKQRVINLDAAAGRGFAPVSDPEPWVHNGAAGSGAEALARATLRSASAPIDVPSAGAAPRTNEAPKQRTEGHQWLSWRRPSAGHTDDAASSSDDDSGASLSEADASPAMSPDAAASPAARARSELSGAQRADIGSQRKADGSADYII